MSRAAPRRAAPFVFTSARDLSCVVYPEYVRRLSTLDDRRLFRESPHLNGDMLLLREMEFAVEFDGKYASKYSVYSYWIDKPCRDYYFRNFFGNFLFSLSSENYTVFKS